MATARRSFEEGATIAIADPDVARVGRAARELGELGAEAHAYQVDVTSDASVAAMVAQVGADLGWIDVLFTSAGFLASGSVTDVSLEDWARTLAVNVTGTFLCARHVLPVMVAAGGGSIVVMSSTAGLVAEPDIAAYCASKGAVLMLGRQMVLDYARHGIRVNVISPGWIDTQFNDLAIARSGGGRGPRTVHRVDGPARSPGPSRRGRRRRDLAGLGRVTAHDGFGGRRRRRTDGPVGSRVVSRRQRTAS